MEILLYLCICYTVNFIAMRSAILWDCTQCRLVVADVLGQPIDPIFKGQAIQEEFCVDCLTLEGGTDELGCPERLVTKCQSTLHKIPEEHRSHLHCSRSLKSHNFIACKI
jgi:hypothetical protein